MTKTKSTESRISPQVSIIIPAFNEAKGIAEVLPRLMNALPDAEIIVVDDGSVDGTAEIALTMPGLHVERHPFNRGYGSALRTGMTLAKGDLIAWFDSDGEHRESDLVAMIDRVGKERLAAVLGRRPSGSSPLVRRTGKWLIRLLAQSVGFEANADLNCGLRVFRRDAIMPYLSLLPSGFSASLTTSLVMIERGYPVAFHPIEIRPRHGESKVVIRDGFAAITLVLRMLMLFAPLRLFLPSGAMLISLGLVYGLTISALDRTGFPTAGLLAILVGLNICMLGLIADQISQMRLARLDNQRSRSSPDAGP